MGLTDDESRSSIRISFSRYNTEDEVFEAEEKLRFVQEHCKKNYRKFNSKEMSSMTIEQIKEMVAGTEYDFLRTNEHLRDRIIFLTLGGSYSYGTNIETSDVDVRGCALNSPSDLLGLTNFEQVVRNPQEISAISMNLWVENSKGLANRVRRENSKKSLRSIRRFARHLEI